MAVVAPADTFNFSALIASGDISVRAAIVLMAAREDGRYDRVCEAVCAALMRLQQRVAELESAQSTKGD